jgi:RecQ family ATP-dependent DNA helicase
VNETIVVDSQDEDDQLREQCNSTINSTPFQVTLWSENSLIRRPHKRKSVDELESETNELKTHPSGQSYNLETFEGISQIVQIFQRQNNTSTLNKSNGDFALSSREEIRTVSFIYFDYFISFLVLDFNDFILKKICSQRFSFVQEKQKEAHTKAQQFSQLVQAELALAIHENDENMGEDLVHNGSAQLLISSAFQMLRSSSCDEFLNREVRKQTFCASKIMTIDRGYGQIDYQNYKLAENFDLCGNCLKSFDSERVKVVASCSHVVCSVCLKTFGEKVRCSNCMLFCEYRNRMLPEIKNSEMSVKWTFDDIQDEKHLFERPLPVYDAKIDDKLVNVFKLKNFRFAQREIIKASLCDKNVFVLMASGGGKSITFQLPATLTSGFYLVISPLKSLIKDQIEQLKTLGIRAAFLDNDMAHYDEVLHGISKNVPTYKIVYMSPEKFQNENVCEDLRKLAVDKQITRLVIDEAHCVRAWGIDFRFAYLHLAIFLKTIFANIPISLYTASVTPTQRLDILKILELDDSEKHKFYYFLSSFDRPNLHYRIENLGKNENDKLKRVHKICTSHQMSNYTGIVYCNAGYECDKVAAYLRKHGVTARAYYSKKNETFKNNTQKAWNRGTIRVIVSTVAFGMGINKSDVRFVIHYVMPKSLENYYQETGRAGRDGNYAACFLLYGDDESADWVSKFKRTFDGKKLEARGDKNMLALAKFNHQAQLEALGEMHNYIKLKRPKCKREELLKYFGQDYNGKKCEYNIETACDNCRRSRYHYESIPYAKQLFEDYKAQHPSEF